MYLIFCGTLYLKIKFCILLKEVWLNLFVFLYLIIVNIKLMNLMQLIKNKCNWVNWDHKIVETWC